MPTRRAPVGARLVLTAGVRSVIVAHDTTEPPGRSQPAEDAIHGLTLRFPPELERPFDEDYFRKSVVQVRIGQIVGAAVYAAFAIIDPCVIPEIAGRVWAMRALIVGCFALGFLFT